MHSCFAVHECTYFEHNLLLCWCWRKHFSEILAVSVFRLLARWLTTLMASSVATRQSRIQTTSRRHAKGCLLWVLMTSLLWVCVFCPLFCSCVCSIIRSVLRREFDCVPRSESPFCGWLYKLGYKMYWLRQRVHQASGERIRHSIRVPGNRCATQYHVRWPLDWDRMY